MSTKRAILSSAKTALLESGYASLSTRRIADTASVPLSQIHYHFGSKKGLVLALLEDENSQLVERQRTMYSDELPLWKQWQNACDYLDEDIESGYVRVLHEMTAAGWSDPEVADAVREMLRKWLLLLKEVAERVSKKLGDFGPFTADDIAVLVGAPFLGIETMVLLGFEEDEFPMRNALRKVGVILRQMES